MIRRLIAISLVLVLLNGTTALACGPFTLEAVFIHTVHPTFPLERFAAGRIGVVQPSYARSYLYTSYRYLSGLSFTPTEQKALVDLWRERLDFRSGEDPAEWSSGWRAVRKKVAGIQDRGAIDVYRSREKPNEYETFVNCTQDSFDTAAATLNQRIAKYGADNPVMKTWVETQDQVFSNCASGRSVPDPDPSITDALLRADRTYQIAAANFYATDFDAARKGFEEIAADSASPWQRTASYLVARTLIRKASLGAAEQKQESLRAAESQLAKVLADRKLAHMHASATRLANLVRLRLHPKERIHELARVLLSKTPNDNLKHDLWDYTFLLDQYLEADKPAPDAVKGDDLSDWITAIQSGSADAFDVSLARWQATRSEPWLIAALSHAQVRNTRAIPLIGDALNVRPASAAFASARFHAIRLLMEADKNDEARTLIDELLKNYRAQFDESSLNLLTSRRMQLARTLPEFLTYAPRVPAALSWNDDGRELPADDETVSTEMKDLKGQPRFDYDAGLALNQQIPLAILKEAAKNTTLPVSLRRDLAQAVWLRAAILGDTKTANELAPILSVLVPELSTLLNAYLSATTADAKRFSAIYAWLKFPGLEPVVDFGIGRRIPLQQQDSYRDNWWCNPSYRPAGDEDESEGPLSFTSQHDLFPLFLSPAEKAVAEGEWARLVQPGAAPNYIAQQVTQWAAKTPGDPRVPEALHLAVLTTRYGCPDEQSGRWSKAAFDLLHRKYPNSTWARKTPYWFKN